MKVNFFSRKTLGFFALICGVVAAISAFLFVPSDIGLCDQNNWGCERRYEIIGKFIFTPTLLVFMLGTLVFVHTRKEKKPWKMTLAALLFGVVVYFFMEDSAGGGWGLPSVSDQAAFGSLLVLVYGAYILSSALKELFGEKFSLIKRIGTKKVFFFTLIIILVVWIIVGQWL